MQSRKVTPIQKVISAGALGYVKQYGDRMPSYYRKVLLAIENCRGEHMGSNLFHCSACGTSTLAARSCSDRHCPSCQSQRGQQWMQTHQKRLLPCNYFMVTFTVPQQLRKVIYSNRRVLYGVMFDCAWQSMRKLAVDKRHLGASLIGALGVLHTWSKQMVYHPHIHFLVPAGGLDDQGKWVGSRQDFFVPVKALSVIFRAKMCAALNELGLLSQVPTDVWKMGWNVNSQNRGNGVRALGYLASYVFRVAISNNRIVRSDNVNVTILCKKEKSEKLKPMTISVVEFVRRFLQHVLPQGFVKVRHYGFMSPSSKVDVAGLSAEMQSSDSPVAKAAAVCSMEAKPLGFICKCGAAMKLSGVYRHTQCKTAAAWLEVIP